MFYSGHRVDPVGKIINMRNAEQFQFFKINKDERPHLQHVVDGSIEQIPHVRIRLLKGTLQV